MEQTNATPLQKLPNEQTAMILGITSFIGCCCTNGILGVILAGIGYNLANKDEKLQRENPTTYAPGAISTWKVVNLVSIILSAISLIWLIYTIATGKFSEMESQYMEMLQKMKK